MQDQRTRGKVADAFNSDSEEGKGRFRADTESRIESLNTQIGSVNTDSKAYFDLAGCYASIRNHAAAIDILRRATSRFPHEGDVHYALLRALHKSGFDEQAMEAGKIGCQLVSSDFVLRLEYELYLPKVYDSEQELSFFHSRFTQGLERCIGECNLDTKDDALRAARGFGRFAPFYLAYQGFNDMPLIRRYGEFVHQVMSAAYPQWSKSSGDIRTPARDRPRVGFVSAYFRRHTVGEHFLGWLTQRDKTAHEAHCYYLGEGDDFVTEEYRRTADCFLTCPDLEKACETISRDQPDVLVFTDVGMDPLSCQLAALKLAPVQCVTYGHPITTGLPTVDYFLSGDLMEPQNAQEQYTEKLLRLPHLGICFGKRVIPRALMTKTRSDFGLPEDAVLYLCCQSLFKYLPQYDHLLPEIALAVPKARFVFVTGNTLLGKKLLRRLARSFSTIGLDAARYCYFLPEQGSFDYWNLHLVSDVFLDPPGWSGGRSTYDAVTCGIPIVTMAGHLARHRQTQAILTLLQVPEMIARDEAHYLTLATELARKPELRHRITDKMASNQSILLGDEALSRVLASFLREAQQNASPQAFRS